MRGAVGRADLARVIADLPAERAGRAARLLGFEAPEEVVEVAPVVEILPAVPTEAAPAAAEGEPMCFWRLEEMTFRDAPEPKRVEPAREASGGLTEDDLRSPGCSVFATPKTPPLALWSRLWPVLRAMLQAAMPGRDPDMRLVVRALGRGEVVRRVPRVARRAWAERASVWVDRSARLVPFWSDQADVCRRLQKACGRSGVEVRLLDDRAQARAIARGGDLGAGIPADPMMPVLVLGDLGSYGDELERAAWLLTARRLRRGGVRVAALVPSSEGRWDRRVARVWGAVPWERGRSRGASRLWKERAARLVRLMSPAAVVQPGLLRAIRRLLPAWQADAATEVDVWNHADVRGADATGLVLHAEAAERWRKEFAAEVDAGLKERVSRLIGLWHGGLPRELLRAETLVWHALAPGLAPPGDLQDAIGFARRLAATARAGEGDPAFATAVRRYGRTLLGGVPASIYDVVPSLKVVWAAAFQGVDGVSVPAGLDPRALYDEIGRAGEPRWWAVRQVGDRLVFSPSPSGAWPSHEDGPGSPVAWLLAAWPLAYVRRGRNDAEMQLVLDGGRSIPLHPGEDVELRTDRCAVMIKPWQREAWAKAAGRDRFGLWADAEVKGVALRLRWIPPGRFRMGSPEGEAGRWDVEGPQHLVTWTRGRWLGDAPVTQALWEAVMGKNPSQFRSPGRPVENVHWDDCREFLRRLDKLAPGLDARLSSEAEWEHACRAGAETATWLGDLEIRGANDAPLLDSIAWYGGNCGVDFELERWFDTRSWPNKQYDHAKGGTHPVRQKDPNPLGLYDMLGNVYEWCLDTWARYSGGDVVDPVAIERTGSLRVVRGGSWRGRARGVRAANRSARGLADRSGRLGFRLARGPGPTTKK